MYINTRIELGKENIEIINNAIEKQLPEIIKEYFTSNPQEITKIIKECVKGQFKSCCNDILQSKELRAYLTEKIMNKLDIDNIR